MTRWDSRSARMLATNEESRNLLKHLDTLMRGEIDTAWVLPRPRTVVEPRRLGARVVVKAPGDAYPAAPTDVVIELLPSRAFGAGGHASTVLCCRALESILRGGERMLDVGTGTGILALAAARLGAAQVLAIDTEPEAVRAARDNAVQNALQQVIEVRSTELSEVTGLWRVIAANLLPEVLCAMAPALAARAEPGGFAVVGGFHATEAGVVQAALEVAGLRLQATSEAQRLVVPHYATTGPADMSEELRVLGPDELEAVIAADRLKYHPTVDPSLHRDCYLRLLVTPWAQQHMQVLGWYHGGELMTSCRAHNIEILINGHKHNCLVLNKVLPLHEDLHRDLAIGMLEAALARSTQEYSPCLLFSESGGRIYKNLGFFPLPTNKYIILSSRHVHTPSISGNGNGSLHSHRKPSLGVMEQGEARPFEPRDLPDVVGIYNLDVSLRKIGVLRTESYWQHLFEKDRLLMAMAPGGAPAQEMRTYVFTIEDRISSYMTVRLSPDRLVVLESPAESFRVQNWMLRYAVLLSHTEALSRVESQLPIKGQEEGIRTVVRRDMPLMMLHPMGSGLRLEDFPDPSETFLWSRDRL